ncbi:cupin domain-containing protein [Francisella frigiditurris]|uniref:ChrR Cupin-like domain protein n=1 Tax=Francisella frigiditurris TaxID=1542390 RepID=A0A1J0KUC1_9GAMM|nr:cupin domain-containing protein [Francisella frigiditurris]APC97279.1 chrR Cupin-like domain protein [Francisella frigiditurris]
MKINIKDIELETFKVGISKKLLARDDQRNFQIDFIRLEPKVKLSKHMHPDVEWVYVMKGSMSDERGEFVSGDFFINPINSIHSVISGPNGCDILCCWCGEIKDC